MFQLICDFNEIIKQDSLFWFCALLGSGLFVVQFLISLLGGSGDVDDGGGEMDAGKFKWLTKHALTGFLLMFGWVGLTGRKEFGFSVWASVAAGTGAGIVCSIVTGLIFGGAKKLHSSGAVFRIEDAVGKEGTVYHKIGKEGGKVTVCVSGFTHEIDAVADEEVASFVKVRIGKKVDGKTVHVIPMR